MESMPNIPKVGGDSSVSYQHHGNHVNDVKSTHADALNGNQSSEKINTCADYVKGFLAFFRISPPRDTSVFPEFVKKILDKINENTPVEEFGDAANVDATAKSEGGGIGFFGFCCIVVACIIPWVV